MLALDNDTFEQFTTLWYIRIHFSTSDDLKEILFSNSSHIISVLHKDRVDTLRDLS